MNNESIAKLRIDRRLHSRRGWIDEQDLQRELDALPDVSDKIMPPEEDEPTEEAPVAPAAQAPAFDAPEGGGV